MHTVHTSRASLSIGPGVTSDRTRVHVHPSDGPGAALDLDGEQLRDLARAVRRELYRLDRQG